MVFINSINLIVCLATLWGTASSTPTARPVCKNGFCYSDASAKFPIPCEERGYVCCKDGDEWTLVNHIPGHKCCLGSGDLYDPATEVCDGGDIRSRLRNEYQCGLTKVYNEITDKCCMGNATHGVVHSKDVVCCNEFGLTGEQDCCGGIIYDKSSQTCCENEDLEFTLHNISNGECCHRFQAYNPATQFCHDDFGVANIGDQSCFNGTHNFFYNNETEICCGGSVYSKSLFLCYKNRRAEFKVNQHHNDVCQTSRSSEMMYVTFDNRRKACIDGAVRRIQKNHGVCGTEFYHIKNDLCCGGYIKFANKKKEGKKCCDHRFQWYDPSTQTCCLGNISEIAESENGRCCGATAFDSKTHKCNEFDQIERILCPHLNGSYPKHCSLNDQDLLQLKHTINWNKGLNAYVITVHSEQGSKPNGKTKKWRITINDAFQVNSLTNLSKRKSIKPNKKLGKIKILEAGKCSCPHQLEIGQKYVIFSEKSLKRKWKIAAKEHGSSNPNTDVIIPLNDVQRIGHVFYSLFAL